MIRDVCREHGYNVVFGGQDDAGITKVAILSSLPISELVCGSACPDPLACGIVELYHGEDSQLSYTKLLIASIYAHACDDVARDIFLKECLQGLSSVNACWIALGDFNLEAEDPSLAPLLASGGVDGLDESFVELPEATRRDGHRRIDLGLAHSSVSAVQRVQSLDVDVGISGHDLVAYDFEVSGIDTGWFRPKRAPFLPWL